MKTNDRLIAGPKECAAGYLVKAAPIQRPSLWQLCHLTFQKWKPLLGAVF